MRDVFICHASEDKDDVVRPLVEAFTEAGISCWYDEAEIRWGDSVTQKINEGLAKSRYVLVVFSVAFVQKNWPQRELNAVLNREASSNEVRVLPLLVGTKEEKKQILEQFPLLNDKRYLPWSGDVKAIVEAMLSRLDREGKDAALTKVGTLPRSGLRIPLPKIRQEFSQRDRDMFLRSGFTVVKRYFQNGLEELTRYYQGVDTDFSEVHKFKFVATIYIRGEVANRCKVWIGGLTSSDAIAYRQGQLSIDSDNSFNDFLSMADNKQVLGFRPSGMWIGASGYSEENLLTAEEAAEYLWRRFTEALE